MISFNVSDYMKAKKIDPAAWEYAEFNHPAQSIAEEHARNRRALSLYNARVFTPDQ